MHPLDLSIIVVYLILMGVIGWWVSKKASRSAECYFLAGKSLPWWVIGVAHGSSGVDITGTMWFVMMLYIYGVKAVWLLWVWPLFSVIFRMMFGNVGASFECAHRSRVDAHSLWGSPGARLAY
jgi:Na+/proline symporter